ncbi:MAG TPA: ComEC/Rec2 family competence protein [Actinomycetota bacterium]
MPRSIALAAAVAAGVVAGEALRPSPVACLALSSGVLILFLSVRAPAAALVLGVAIGIALAGLKLAALEDAALARGGATGARALMHGRVLTDATDGAGEARAILAVGAAEIDGEPVRVHERVLLTIRPPPGERLEAGALVRVDAALRPLAMPGADAAILASAARLRHRGVAARAFAEPDAVTIVGRAGDPLTRVADAGRAAIRDAAARIPERHRGLLLGVTIGDVTLLDPAVEVDFRTTGLLHLVAVSGANVAMVLAVVALLVRLLRAGRRVSIACLGLTVLAFVAVTRFEPSVMRAGVMAVVGLAALLTGTRAQALNALGLACLTLLCHDPFLVYSAGFQLSAVATLGILVIGPRVAARLPPGRIAAVAAVTLGAQLAVGPLIALRFHQVSLIGLAANLVVAPVVAPATILGMVAGVLGAAWAPLGSIAWGAVPFLWWMQRAASALAHLPLAAVRTPDGAGGVATALALGVVAVVVVMPARATRGARTVLVGVLLFVAGAAVLHVTGPPPDGGLVVTMLDVGQGEAIVVRAGGHAMLVDGGPDPDALVRHLREAGIERLDVMVISHPHEDHVAGLTALPGRIPIGRALDPFIEDDLASYRALVDGLDAAGVPRERARAGTTFALGEARVEVLWPPLRQMAGTPSDVNNNSVVMRIAYGEASMLYAGETEEAAQAELLARPAALRADVLKVSHHGSARMLPAFYASTGAALALIPVGPNSFGHPAPATLEALSSMEVLRTDLAGTVTVRLGTGGAWQAYGERAA